MINEPLLASGKYLDMIAATYDVHRKVETDDELRVRILNKVKKFDAMQLRNNTYLEELNNE